MKGAVWDDRTIVRGASERLVPILMTAIVTALGLAPLAVGMNQPGQEIEGPMAITVLGGLADLDLAQSSGAAGACQTLQLSRGRRKPKRRLRERYASEGE